MLTVLYYYKIQKADIIEVDIDRYKWNKRISLESQTYHIEIRMLTDFKPSKCSV